MHVKWGSLVEVAVVSFGATVGVVVLFALGVWALAARDQHRASGGEGTAQAISAGACFVVCACAVLYGLYLIIPQFH
ncbi:hypothetical protein OG896_01575 [Streptomyces sp. NBC_00669]|jgi:UPF0716 family protein affecting phage T7 exclusion|uniref:hypothetical protein n=1 Tax=unclassified Streptomyces TaxID=2593676 RepID=UPI002E32D5FD|nr:hypothetical protein [Streptomyces sp. NBC_00669]